MNDGVGSAPLVDQAGVLSVVVVTHWEELERISLRIERHPLLIVPDDDGVIAVLDQLDGRRFPVVIGS